MEKEMNVNSSKSNIRKYAYNIGDMRLDFSLNVDSKQDLTAFKALLLKAVEDVTADIEAQ